MDGATKSKIEVGWHPSWEGEERRRDRRRPETRFLSKPIRDIVVKCHLRYGLRGLRYVELELSSCEFKTMERREER